MRPTTFLPRRIPLASNPVPRRLYYGVRFLSSENVPTLIKRNDIPAPHVGHIRILSLNNPRTRNAISRQLLSELSSEIRAIRQEVEDEAAQGETAGTGTRVLILASEVKEAFCAGADLKERKAMSREEYVPYCPHNKGKSSKREPNLTILMQNKSVPILSPLNLPKHLNPPHSHHERRLLCRPRRRPRTRPLHRLPRLRT